MNFLVEVESWDLTVIRRAHDGAVGRASERPQQKNIEDERRSQPKWRLKMKTVSVSEAKMKLSGLIDTIQATDEEVMITKNARPAYTTTVMTASE